MENTPQNVVKVVKIPKLYPWQKEIINHPARHVFVIAGRRIGKTLVAQVKAIKALVRSKLVLWLAPVYNQLKDNYRDLAEILAPITTSYLTNDEIIVHGGGRIRFRSADNPDSCRGQTADLVIFDEISFCKNDEALRKAIKVLRPMLTERQGSCFYISSPNGHNYAYHLFEKCKQSPNWCCRQHPWTVSPHIKPEEVAEAKMEMLSSEFRQEYEASFESPTGALFEPEWLKDIFVTQDQMPPPNQRQRSFVAVDLALGQLKGKRLGDYQAVVALLVKDKICYADCWAGRVPIPVLAQKVKDMCDFYQVEGSAWEDNGFQSLAQADFLKLHDVSPYVVCITNQVEKATRIARLATLLKRGHLRILDNEGGRLLHQQLQDFPMGKHSYDTLDALEMCWGTLCTNIRK